MFSYVFYRSFIIAVPITEFKLVLVFLSEVLCSVDISILSLCGLLACIRAGLLCAALRSSVLVLSCGTLIVLCCLRICRSCAILNALLSVNGSLSLLRIYLSLGLLCVVRSLTVLRSHCILTGCSSLRTTICLSLAILKGTLSLISPIFQSVSDGRSLSASSMLLRGSVRLS